MLLEERLLMIQTKRDVSSDRLVVVGVRLKSGAQAKCKPPRFWRLGLATRPRVSRYEGTS